MLDNSKFSHFKVICEVKECYCNCFNIFVYDLDGILIFNKKINNNNTVEFPIKSSETYRIRVCAKHMLTPLCINSWVTIEKDKNYSKYFCFNLKESCKHKEHITLKLTDQNYNGLPISRGKISLWQNIT